MDRSNELEDLKGKRRLLQKQIKREKRAIKRRENEKCRLEVQFSNSQREVHEAMITHGIDEWDDERFNLNLEMILWYHSKLVSLI